jgi:hypothetical protein
MGRRFLVDGSPPPAASSCRRVAQPPRAAEGAYINYNRRGWRTKGEPLDDAIKNEEPRVLRRALKRLRPAGAALHRLSRN